MDVVLLSRVQFAMTCMFHFLYVPLTLGLVILLAIMETLYVTTKKEIYKQMTQFWGKFFLINFAIGVVTGLTLEFQFGTNWARYAEYVGDVFGSLLAIEASSAFFLESTFIAIWAFGWKKVSKKIHLFSIWMVAFATNASAFWILSANAWMQHPVGYVIRNNRAELTDFFAMTFQPMAIQKFIHTIGGSYVLGGMFVMSISAYHLLKKNNIDFFKKSLKFGLIFATIALIATIGIGHNRAILLAQAQPAKMAAFESQWVTEKNPPLRLFAIPDEKGEKNIFEISLPGMLKYALPVDKEIGLIGMKEIPKGERPPILPSMLTFRIMLGTGLLMLAILLTSLVAFKKIEEYPILLKIILFSLPLPYIAIETGWAATEIGRQPWIVYGLMKVSDGTSTIINGGQVFTTLIALTILYTILLAVNIFLMVQTAKKGPELEG